MPNSINNFQRTILNKVIPDQSTVNNLENIAAFCKNALPEQQETITPVSNSTVNIVSKFGIDIYNKFLIIAGLSNVDNLTLLFPLQSTCIDGQEITVTFLPQVSATFNGNGASVVTAYGAGYNIFYAKTSIKFKFFAGNWYQIGETISDYLKTTVPALLPNLSGRNRLINGNFDVWQRATSFTATTSGVYTADRWLCQTVSGTGTVSRLTHSLANAAYGKYYLSYNQNKASGTIILQRIESVLTFAGQIAILSFYANFSAGATQNIYFSISQKFGGGGSPSSTVFFNTDNILIANTGFQKYSIVLNMPSIAGKTLGTNGTDNLEIAMVLPSGNYTFDTFGWQLESGSVATPFEYRPLSHEITLSKRYGQMIDHLSLLHARTTTQLETSIMFPIEMRTSPSIDATYSQLYNVYDAFGVSFTQSSFNAVYAVSGPSPKGAFINLGNFTGLTQGGSYVTNAASSGKIFLSAEL